MASSTAKLLAELSDEGQFERLATAVLREADPRYSSLVHPGVNVDGKTVKAPLDGITFISGAEPAHLVAVHHTTTRAADLRSKWLHDPSNVKPRRATGPTAPAGDLVKTASIVASERTRNPQLQATLVLTTNQEPSVDVVRDVHDEATKHDIIVDLWPRSRLAHFLDKPQGQWLRHAFFGIEPEHLSRELFTKLSRDSAQNFKPADDQSEIWVDRALDRVLDEASEDVVFVVAESGFGKSVACYKKLVRHTDHGGFGFFLSHEIVETALNLNQALGLALQQLYPRLGPNAAAEALALCQSAHSLLIVVEDINRTGKAPQLLEKLANWGGPTAQAKDRTALGHNSWQLFCPVWPEQLAALKDQTRQRVEALSVTFAPFTTEESRLAVQRRAALEGHQFSDLDADAIAAALGHDPLLIALHAPHKVANPNRVLDEFIWSSSARAASAHSEFTAPDYHSGLTALSKEMLRQRVMDPEWSEVTTWFGLSGSITNILRSLLRHGEIVRLATGGPNARLRFRHDRVRETILSSGVASMVRDGSIEDSLLSDPYFAEIIGGALTDPAALEPFIKKVAVSNPLALFYGLRRLGNSNGANRSCILAATNAWLDSEEAHDSAHQRLRWQALSVLAQTDSADVVPLTQRFQERGWSAWFARLRNGDVSGGVELCQRLEPGSNAPWRDVQIDHAKNRFGSSLISKVAELLERADVPAEFRQGTLRLAGHLASPELSNAISTSWSVDSQRQSHLADYLWAGAQCCGASPERLLAPVCDAWAALPSVPGGQRPSPRDEMAAHNVKYAFRRWPPIRALKYLIQRAQGAELSWPILYLLHTVDTPDTVEFVARRLADMARPLEGTKRFSHFVMSATDPLDRDHQHGLPPLSGPSKARLLSLWTSPRAERHLRIQAFRLWAASEAEGDLEILWSIGTEDELFDRALFQRLKRGDHTAIPKLIEKLKATNDDSYWWQVGRYLWSDEMTAALDDSFTRRGQSALRQWDKPEQQSDWMTSENVLRLPPEVAERLLIKRWDHLRFVPSFVQAALYTASPQLRSLVETTMSECPNPKELMQFIDSHYNLNGSRGTGVTRIAQVESLVPYFHLFSDLSIDQFWRHCNKQGWFEFRRQHLDPRVTFQRYAELLGGNGTIKALDRFLEDERLLWLDHWLDDCIEAGATIGQLVSELSSWLSTKASIPALRIVAAALAHIGRRCDLPVLNNVPIEPRDAAQAIIADAAFAVMRRTLH